MKGNVIQLNFLRLNTIQMNGTKEVQGEMATGGSGEIVPPSIPTYVLSAGVSNGSVTATLDGNPITLPYTAYEGEIIMLTVTPNEGYEFEGWDDGYDDNPRAVLMTRDISLSASCSKVVIPIPTYTLSASVANGVVSASLGGATIALPYLANEGDTIVISVTPNEGYEFNGWADGNTDNPRTITMTADVVLSAQCVEVVQPPVGNYIQFEDKAVEAICVANWSSDGIGLTMEDAAAVTSIGTTFSGNTEITSFDELRYFTGLTFLSTTTSTNTGAFAGCSSLESIVLPTSVTIIGDFSFSKCSALKAVGGMDNVVRVQRYAFSESAVEELILPSCTFFGVGIASQALTKKIVAPLLQKIDGSFNKAQHLELLDAGTELTEIATYSFWAMASNKTTFICRATTPPSMGGNNNMTFCSAIYVPDASLEAYKIATNWTTYASRIKGISEYNG